MRDETSRLFDEFAAEFARGGEPDLRTYLARAGDEAPVFARLADAFLAGSAPPAPDPERVELMRAWVQGEPPLLELRKARKLKRADLVARLTALLGLAPEREEKVGRYYHELEAGLLEPRGVDARVWEALRQLFDTDVREAARWRPAPIRAEPAFRLSESSRPPLAAAPAGQAEPDEVDRLFRSGR